MEASAGESDEDDESGEFDDFDVWDEIRQEQEYEISAPGIAQENRRIRALAS
jgi:hypothetical protein